MPNVFSFLFIGDPGNILNMDSSCAGGNISPSDMSGSSSHTSPQPTACSMDEHITGSGGGKLLYGILMLQSSYILFFNTVILLSRVIVSNV